VEKLAQDLWRFTARHPDWHPKGFGDEVAGFALRDDEGLVLIDPLVSDDEDELEALDALAGTGPVTIFITIPFHARSAAELAQRWDDVQVLSHPATQRKLPAGTPFQPIEPGQPLPHGAIAFNIGSPKRQELPIYLPRARALAFGDAVVGVDGGLRVWIWADTSQGWFEDRFRPTLEPLTQLDIDRVLVTHGPPVMSEGAHELSKALAAGAWSPRRAKPRRRASARRRPGA
jgi:glyoxylase-like metal-dependent hydrolase (beta-lactamase superfamily II)